MTIERHLSPEEEELLVKQAELEALADQLAQKELARQTIRAEIDAFFRAYNFAIESKVVEAKELRARVAQCIYVLNPTESARFDSQEARTRADEAERDHRRQAEAPKEKQSDQPESFAPSPELRTLYRDLVKKAHPDLAKDEEDRLRRNEFMVRVNQAYRDGDEAALQSLADEWATGGGPVEVGSIGDQLVRLIRQIADVRNHLGTVDSEIEALKRSEDYLLVKQAEEARSSGRDLIAEHAAQMNDHVEVLRSKINDLSDQLKAIYDG